MNDLNQYENKSSFKKAIVPAILLAVLSALYIYKDSVLNFFTNTKAESLAEVTAFRNDVRRKDSKSIDFTAAQDNQKIYHGDSLSTGASSTALVTFKSGQILNVDQNSLIIFDELTDTPEFVKGNVKITVKGKMKLKVDNEIIEIDGGNTRSDIQIYKDEKAKAQKIVLLKGNAQIQSPAKKAFIPLQKNIPIEPKKVIMASDLLKDTRQPSQVHPQPTVPVLARPPVVTSGNYKLYDYYSRLLSSNTELGRNRNFSLKPNYKFESFAPSTVAITPQGTSDDPTQTYTVRIEDPSHAQGYVVEVSQDESFSDGQTQYNWKNSYFTQNFSTPGNYYFRYRKVLNGQALTDYSPTERISVIEKPKPVVVTKPEPPVQPVKKIVPVKKTQVVKKAEPVKTVVQEKPAVERAPSAVSPQTMDTQAMQSTIKTDSTEILRNQNYSLSNVGISAGQAFMVSGQQLSNSNEINTSYGLQISGLHWLNQNGFRASYAKALSSQNSVNLVTQAEFDYLRRFNQSFGLASGGNFQYYVSLGLETYQNSQATSDFVDSYNLYKLGVGASMPIFSFWSIDGQMSYGFGDSQKSSLFFSTRANYFITKTVSIGLGFRARKFDYYLLDQKNYESLSETYTILNMYY